MFLVENLGHVDSRRAAHEHVRNRSLNERLSTQGASRTATGPWLLVCECGREGCAEPIEVSQTEYAAARSHESLYLVAPGHDSPGVTSTVADVGGRFLLVELLRSA